MTLLEHALHLASLGFRVFPLQPNSKEPWPGHSWPDLATTDTARISEYWSNTPDANIGIACGQGVSVIDLDPDKSTLEDQEAFLAQHDVFIDDFMSVETPRGGFHIYASDDIANSVSGIFPGIDTRGNGGYVVGPGSIIDGRHYVAVADRTVHSLGTVGHELCHAFDTPAATIQVSQDVDLDHPANVTRAKQHVMSLYEGTQQGERDVTLFKAAATVCDYGLSDGVALGILLELNEAFEEPDDTETVEAKLASARRNSQNVRSGIEASKSLHRAFLDYGAMLPPEVREQSSRPSEARSALPEIVRVGDLADLPPIEWLVDGFIEKGSTCLFIGDTNTYKTYQALALANCIVRGIPWNGYEIPTARPVLYMAGEGRRGVYSRIQAWQNTHAAGDEIEPLHIMLGCAQFNDPEHLKGLDAFLGKYPDCVVVIDTLSKASAGWSENDNDDMNAFIARCDEMSRERGATSIVLHHPAKSTQMARGASALRLGADTELSFNSDAKGSVSLRMTMQRNADTWEQPMNLKAVRDAQSDNITFVINNDEEVTKPTAAQSSAHWIRLALNDCLTDGRKTHTPASELKGQILTLIAMWVADGSHACGSIPTDKHVVSEMKRIADKGDARAIKMGRTTDWQPGPDPSIIEHFS
ncbi:MAG: AAA family ATPase [Pseudohongiellaceae bacterium]